MKVQHDREYIYHQIPSSSFLNVEKLEYKYDNNEIEFDSNNSNIPFYINSFTARTLSARTNADKVFFRGMDENNTLSGSWFWSDNIFYQLQSQFFPINAYNKNNYITNPWTGASVSSLHCIAFSNHLFKDKLEDVNSDIIISITGDLEGSSFIGYGYYDTSIFLYTDSLFTISNNYQFTKTKDSLKIQEWDDLGLNYVFIQAKVYYDANSYYKISGGLLKDYGLIILFNNENNWSNFETARINNKSSTLFGSIAYPAVWWKILEQTVNYSYIQCYHDYKINLNLSWDKANYTSNITAKNSFGEYKFNTINDLDQLSQINKNLHPRSYITTVFLMNDYNDVMAIGKFPKPIKKDFLNEYNFNIRIRV